MEQTALSVRLCIQLLLLLWLGWISLTSLDARVFIIQPTKGSWLGSFASLSFVCEWLFNMESLKNVKLFHEHLFSYSLVCCITISRVGSLEKVLILVFAGHIVHSRC